LTGRLFFLCEEIMEHAEIAFYIALALLGGILAKFCMVLRD
jgi:hypothetical protein